MMATNYQRGYAFENKFVRWLRGLGFVVIRSAGSKGPVDIIAWDDTTTYLFQLKTEATRPEIEEAKAKLAEIVCPWPAQREVVIKGNPKLGDWFTRHEV